MLLIGTAISMLTAVARDACLPLAARGVEVPREPPRDRHHGRRHHVLAQDRLHQPPPPLVRDLGPDRRRLDPRARRPRPQPRHRLQGRHADRVHDAAAHLARAGSRPDRARSASRTPSSRAAGRPTNGELQELPDPHRDADDRTRRRAARPISKKTVKADAFGVKNVSASFGRQIARSRHPRDHRLAAPDRRLHLAPLPVAVRRPGDRRARPRHPHHDRDLRAARAGGDDRHGRRGPDRARVLDLRHDHHLRPHQGEHPADEAGIVPADHERLAVGDDPAVTRDDLHHAAADPLAARLRRRHAERLRLRAPHRHRLGRLLVDLRRGSAARLDQGAGARVGASQARGRGRRSSRSAARCSWTAPRWPRRRRSCSLPSPRRPLRRRRPLRQPRRAASAVAPAAPRARTAAPARKPARRPS